MRAEIDAGKYAEARKSGSGLSARVFFLISVNINAASGAKLRSIICHDRYDKLALLSPRFSYRSMIDILHVKGSPLFNGSFAIELNTTCENFASTRSRSCCLVICNGVEPDPGRSIRSSRPGYSLKLSSQSVFNLSPR